MRKTSSHRIYEIYISKILDLDSEAIGKADGKRRGLYAILPKRRCPTTVFLGPTPCLHAFNMARRDDCRKLCLKCVLRLAKKTFDALPLSLDIFELKLQLSKFFSTLLEERRVLKNHSLSFSQLPLNKKKSQYSRIDFNKSTADWFDSRSGRDTLETSSRPMRDEAISTPCVRQQRHH